MMNDDPTIAGSRFPRWQARLVPDEDAGEPCGDALAPAMIIGRCGETRFAQEVYQPAQAGWIVAAWHHFGDHGLFERYLRSFHGTANIASAGDCDITVLIFDTGDYREHAGITGECDLGGEQAEWEAWLDGDVYGVIVEHHHTGITRWDDDTTSIALAWTPSQAGVYSRQTGESCTGTLPKEHSLTRCAARATRSSAPGNGPPVPC